MKFCTAAAATVRPTSTLPVKLTHSLRAFDQRLATFAAATHDQLDNFGGQILFGDDPVRATAEAEKVPAASTTALNASAGALQLAVAVGKRGETIATTPTASRRTSISISGRTESAVSPI